MRDAVAFVAVVTCVYFQLALEKPVHCTHSGGLGHECGGKFAHDLGLHFVANNLAHVVSEFHRAQIVDPEPLHRAFAGTTSLTIRAYRVVNGRFIRFLFSSSNAPEN
jgi:hypothetical protein